MNKDIDDLTKSLHKGATDAFKELEHLRMVVINVKIATAKMDGPEARALAKTGEIITEALVELQQSTKMVREAAKKIAEINKREEGF